MVLFFSSGNFCNLVLLCCCDGLVFLFCFCLCTLNCQRILEFVVFSVFDCVVCVFLHMIGFLVFAVNVNTVYLKSMQVFVFPFADCVLYTETCSFHLTMMSSQGQLTCALGCTLCIQHFNIT